MDHPEVVADDAILDLLLMSQEDVPRQLRHAMIVRHGQATDTGSASPFPVCAAVPIGLLLSLSHHLHKLVHIDLAVAVGVDLGHHLVCHFGRIAPIGKVDVAVLVLHRADGSYDLLLLKISVPVHINDAKCVPRGIDPTGFGIGISPSTGEQRPPGAGHCRVSWLRRRGRGRCIGFPAIIGG